MRKSLIQVEMLFRRDISKENFLEKVDLLDAFSSQTLNQTRYVLLKL